MWPGSPEAPVSEIPEDLARSFHAWRAGEAAALAVLGLDHVRGTGKRIAFIVGVAIGLALVWAELAVGVFSREER